MQKDRRTYISSTEVGAILGISKYNTPYEIWEKKVGLAPQNIEDNDVMLWGRLLEPVIIKEIERRCNVVIGITNPFVQHPKYSFLCNHPDGIDTSPIKHEVNNEVKTVASWAFNQWEEATPLEYYCQIQYEMDIAIHTYPHIRKTRFSVLEMDARKLHIDYVHYDPEFCEKLRNQLIHFWEYNVIGNNPPDYQVSDFAKSKDILGAYNDVDAEFVKKIVRRRQFNEELKKMNESIDALDNEIKMKIGDSEGIRYGVDVLASWKEQSKNSVDSKKLKDEYPDIYEKVIRESKFRVLRVKNK
jgi:putative phage-type endonuclease